MRVFIVDYPPYKTTKHWQEYLRSAGHEVLVDLYWNPVYAQWADVIWVEWCETPAIEASKLRGHYPDVYDQKGICGNTDPSHVHSGDFDWSGKRIFIRPIDIDIYNGAFRQVQWENVEAICYIAPHFWEMLSDLGRPYPDSLKVVETRLGVKVDDWTFRKRDGSGRDIAWVNHHWSAKGLPLALYALRELIDRTGDLRWKLHVVQDGQSNEGWYHRYVLHQIKALGLTEHVVMQGRAPSVDAFLEDKEFLWHTSMKEGFSLIIGEALAKGIRALTLDWESSRAIWPETVVCATPSEMVDRTMKMSDGRWTYDSDFCRMIAEERSHEKEIALLRKLTGL